MNKTSKCLADITTEDFSQEAVEHYLRRGFFAAASHLAKKNSLSQEKKNQYFRIGLITVLGVEARNAAMRVERGGQFVKNLSEADIRILMDKLLVCARGEGAAGAGRGGGKRKNKYSKRRRNKKSKTRRRRR